MQACPLSPRDLLHMDYAICFGYAELYGLSAHRQQPELLDWPGPLEAGMAWSLEGTRRLLSALFFGENFDELEEDPSLEDDDLPFDL